ncbi:MAG TPA: methyl-accepting chemotaxis protein [Myxococcota bacterium]|nr:methyl-accepting chemotaxis protein [Myxococcota bacterium]
MESGSLPSGRAFVLDLRLVEMLLSAPAVVVLVFYLNGVLAFSLHDWRAFGNAIGGYVVVLAVAGDFWRRHWWRPIQAFLDAAPDERDRVAPAAFAATMSLPRQFLQYHLGAWAAAGLFGTAGVAAWGEREWGAFEHATTLLAGLTGGLVAGTALFFGLRQRLGRLREALAARIPDPRARGARIRRVSLRTKLMLTVASSGLASVVFAALLAYASAANGMSGVIGDWQARALLGAEGSLATEGAPADTADHPPSDSRDEAHRAPIELVRLAPGADPLDAPPQLGETVARQIQRRMDDGATSGSARDAGRIVSWRRLPDGGALAAVTSATLLEPALRSVAQTIIEFLGLAAAISAGLVMLFARDVDHATRALAGAALRMSKGDLRRDGGFDSDDELGELARTYEETCDALRVLIGDVTRAAARVDGAALDLSSVSQRLAGGAGEQAREMDRATGAMEQIHDQVQRLSGAAGNLSASMDAAGSSIAELGVTGEQLRETAATLSGRADEVLSSIEESVRASRGVAESSETLSGAAAETSGSMEQMAAAMQVVTATTERMGRLVDAVQRSAEDGRARVGETIEGMAEIEQATGAAGRVVHGLVGAAKEIGAILDVIDEVADQTNLLALNAAIIAAQSGENGRAFKVVADQIRALAERVLASTSQIGALIETLREESARAVVAIEQGTRSVAAGVERSAQAGRSLDEITAAARESGAFTAEIVGAVREQTQAAAHVVDLMARVLGGVERIRAAEGERGRGNELITRSSTAMRDVARQVRNTSEEQARGHAHIQATNREVREITARMNAALQDQTTACADVARFLERVLERTRENDGDAQRMADAAASLVKEAEALRQGTRRFRL